MKISVSSYSFSQMMRDDGLTQKDCIAKAKELGFDAIDFAEIATPDGMTDKDYVLELVDEAHKVGIEIQSFALGADFINRDADEEVKRICGLLDAVALTDAKVIRHDATQGNKDISFDKALPILADACRRIAEYAQTKGIKTTVENHGFFCQDSNRVERLYNAVNHPNFGLLVDIGNFTCADEKPEIAVGRTAPYAAYVHIKDFHIKNAEGTDPGEGFFTSRNGTYLRGAIIGHGDVPVRQCLKTLKKAGYDGNFAIEFEGIEHPMTGLRIGLANLRKYLEDSGL